MSKNHFPTASLLYYKYHHTLLVRTASTLRTPFTEDDSSFQLEEVLEGEGNFLIKLNKFHHTFHYRTFSLSEKTSFPKPHPCRNRILENINISNELYFNSF